MPARQLSSMFSLDHPQSVGVFDTYEQAQAAVDHLADSRFAVENLCIVGTDLRRVERVLGRRTWGTVLVGALGSGVSTGLLVGLMLLLFSPGANPLAVVASGLMLGIIISAVFAAMSYLMSRGQRDFNSITQTVATRYEVLSEHKVATEARALLAQAPGGRAAQHQQATQQPAASYGPDQRFDPITGEPVPSQVPTSAPPPSTPPQDEAQAWGRESEGR